MQQSIDWLKLASVNIATPDEAGVTVSVGSQTGAIHILPEFFKALWLWRHQFRPAM